MVKKKISGQTIAIIVLVFILILTIGFGAVYAYFSTTSNSVTGKITMANLNIDLRAEHTDTDGDDTASSDKSEIILSSTNVLPDQTLKNSALVVMNGSDADVYLIVVYRIDAIKDGGHGEPVVDDFDGCLIDIGVDYINNSHSTTKKHDNSHTDTTRDLRRNTDWVDYVFTYTHDQGTPDDTTDDTTVSYRCLVCTKKFDAPAKGTQNRIEVIAKDSLGLHKDMDNDYQTAELTFTFQAYVIGAGEGFVSEINGYGDDVEKKCETIVTRTYESQDFTFLNVTANQ